MGSGMVESIRCCACDRTAERARTEVDICPCPFVLDSVWLFVGRVDLDAADCD